MKKRYFPKIQKTIIHTAYRTDIYCFRNSFRSSQPYNSKQLRRKCNCNQLLEAENHFVLSIYELWKEISEDNDLDLFELLKERSEENLEKLSDIERDDVSQIFLFFDYDGHAPKASDKKIEKMLELFGEETETGKLYISYPMAEALKDHNDKINFKDRKVDAKDNIRYKELVGKNTKFQDFRKLDWDFVTPQNIKKTNYIVAEKYDIPVSIDNITQNLIFKKQLNNYIEIEREVAVLSGFPLFIAEYFGLKICL